MDSSSITFQKRDDSATLIVAKQKALERIGKLVLDGGNLYFAVESSDSESESLPLDIVLGSSGGLLAVMNDYTLDLTGTITGESSSLDPFVKTGSGTLVLSGQNTYKSPTGVIGGRLVVNSGGVQRERR